MGGNPIGVEAQESLEQQACRRATNLLTGPVANGSAKASKVADKPFHTAKMAAAESGPSSCGLAFQVIQPAAHPTSGLTAGGSTTGVTVDRQARGHGQSGGAKAMHGVDNGVFGELLRNRPR